MRLKIALAAGLGAALLAGCADNYDRPYTPTAASATTTTVVRDAYGNPISRETTVRDAYGNPVAASTAAGYRDPYRDAYGRPIAPGTAVVPRDCEATPLHQDRPGGSDYNPARGAPSC